MAAKVNIDWYVCRSGHCVGPMSDIELALLAHLRQLRETDHIWCAGLPEWVAASSLEGFLPATSPPPASRSQSRDIVPNHGLRPTRLVERYHARLVDAPAQPIDAVASYRSQHRTDIQPYRRPGPEPAATRELRSVPQPQDAPPWLTDLAAGFSPPSTAVDLPRLADPDNKLPVAAPYGSATDFSSLLSRENRRVIAETLARVLKDRGVHTTRDLAHNDFLATLARYAIGELPFVLRIPLVKAIGQERLETALVYALILVRERMMPDVEIKDVVVQVLDSDWLERQVRTVLAVQGTVKAAYDALPSRVEVAASVTGVLGALRDRVSGVAGSMIALPAPSARAGGVSAT